MKKALFLAMSIVACGIAYVAADTTFSWSNSNQSGTLTYTGLGLASPVISGTVTDTATHTLASNSVYVGNDSGARTAMGIAPASEISLSQDGTNITLTIDPRVVDGESLEAVAPGYLLVGSASSNAEPVAVSGVITMANDGTTALATAVEDQIAYLTITGADLATNGTGTITIQLKDQAGNDLAAAALVRTWIGTANDYGVDALTDYSVSTGTEKEEVTANGEYLAITDGSGTIVMAVDYAGGGAGSVYAWAEVGGRIVASGEVALTAP